MDRIQQLSRGNVVYRERCCPNSYGIVVRQPFSPMLHALEDMVQDPRDNKKWAERQIHWFIKQVSWTKTRVPAPTPFFLPGSFRD